MAKTPIDKLASAIESILQEYAEDLQQHVDDAAQEVGKAGVKALRAASKSSFGGSGKYARGWTSKTDGSRIGKTVTLHNDYPGMPHLLENGHAKRGGGRVPGRSHIAQVEQEINEKFEAAVKEAIRK